MSKANRRARDEYIQGSLGVPAFARDTLKFLEPHGFNKDNTLVIVSVCRDEVMKFVHDRLRWNWGATYDIGGLGGLIAAGKTGFTNALMHAPTGFPKLRYVIVGLTNIGFGENGEPGQCIRPGINYNAGANGALIAYQNELISGQVNLKISIDDYEYDILKNRLSQRMPNGKTDLITITQTALAAIEHDINQLTAQLIDASKCDYAVFTATQLHFPTMQLIKRSQSYAVIDQKRVEF